MLLDVHVSEGATFATPVRVSSIADAPDRVLLLPA